MPKMYKMSGKMTKKGKKGSMKKSDGVRLRSDVKIKAHPKSMLKRIRNGESMIAKKKNKVKFI